MPTRIQRRRTRGWRMPQGARYVGRPTIFGNPFKPGDALAFPYEGFGSVVRDQAHAVEVFGAFARWTSLYDSLVRTELKGLDLACWCRPGDPCHADILLAIANEEPTA